MSTVRDLDADPDPPLIRGRPLAPLPENKARLQRALPGLLRRAVGDSAQSQAYSRCSINKEETLSSL